MIHFDKEKLQACQPAMSAAFAARMEKMLHALPRQKEEKKAKRLPVRGIIVVAIMIISLLSMAVALSRPAILDWLLHDSPASPQLEDAAQEIHSKSTVNSITIRLTGLVYDGSQLAFSYEVENADPTRPALVLLDNALVLNGLPVGIPHYAANSSDARLVPSPHLDVLPVRRNPLPGGSWSNRITEALTGEVTGEVTFIVYRPQESFAFLIPSDHMLRDETITDPVVLAEIADCMTTLEGFQDIRLINAEWENADAQAADGCTLLAPSGRPVFPVDDPRCHVVEAACITVPFSFNADKAFSCDYSGTSCSLPDCTVKVEQFLLTPLVTRIHLCLIPAENTKEAVQALADKYGAFTLTDENGQPVAYSEMDSMYGNQPTVVCVDGQWLCRYREEMPGLQDFPSSIGFTGSTGDLMRVDLPIPE